MTYSTETDTFAAARSSRTPRYSIQPGGVSVIEHYDVAAPFSSMLPGIAGMEGVPLWCLYVNRGQGVVSFGVDGKDGAIAEYLPATWAYQLVGIQGFRTFCKIDDTLVEPFSSRPRESDGGCDRTMRIEPDRLTLVERDEANGLHTTVEYFSPAGRPVGSLVRVVTIQNIDSVQKRLSVLDGLPIIVPAGCSNDVLKSMRRLTEAYAAVRLMRDHVSLFQTKVRAHDAAEVELVDRANFFASWLVGADRLLPLKPVVDPFLVFGEGNDLVTPRGFLRHANLADAPQQWENRLACAFAEARVPLAPEDSLTLVSVYGSGASEQQIAAHCAGFVQLDDVYAARRSSRDVTRLVMEPALTVSRSTAFDAYARQNLLDNVLRGGVPVTLPSTAGTTPVHVYARRHGDLERDYNEFALPPTPMSTGPGNYRDICQNRRSDVWLYSTLDDEEIRMFVSLLQADGYNPLSVDGYRWSAPEGANLDCPAADDNARDHFTEIVRGAFQPGDLLQWLVQHEVFVSDRRAWLESVLVKCNRELQADGFEGGYWIDHWTYITDLLEAYAGLYPDRVPRMLMEKDDIGWFNAGAGVLSRRDKYVRRDGRVQQIGAVDNVASDGHSLPRVTVLGKLVSLIAIKAVSFDPDCRGIEMEAGRPGWNDSLNGLPALFGSSTCEAAELARFARWLLDQAAPLIGYKAS